MLAFAKFAKWLRLALLATTFAVCLIIVFQSFCYLAYLMQASFYSPKKTHLGIRFFESRDQFLLYAMPEHAGLQYVAPVEEEDYYRYDYGQWTKDGEMFVCYVALEGEVSGQDNDNSVGVIAYDFSSGRKFVPPWLLKIDWNVINEASNWANFEPAIRAAVASHGGLNGPRISIEDVRWQERTIWFWKIPDQLK